jgi:hypothetical protein
MRTIIAAAFVVAWCSVAAAQSPMPTQNGEMSKAYHAPSWGHSGVTAWGTYSGNIGQGGWHYQKQLGPNEPLSSVLADPNALNSNFANPRTGATLFQPADTRLKGRDRPYPVQIRFSKP